MEEEDSEDKHQCPNIIMVAAAAAAAVIVVVVVVTVVVDTWSRINRQAGNIL